MIINNKKYIMFIYTRKILFIVAGYITFDNKFSYYQNIRCL